MKISIALSCAATLGFAAACGEEEAAAPPPPPSARYAADPAALKRGKLIFRSACGAYCHKLRPSRSDAPYLFDCVWKHGSSDADIFRVIAEGVPDTRMLGFGGPGKLSDEDLWKVIAFLRSQANCS